MKCRKIFTTMKTLRLTALNLPNSSVTTSTIRISKASKEPCSRSPSSKSASTRISKAYFKSNPSSTTTSKTKIKKSFKFLRNSKASAVGLRTAMNSEEWLISPSLPPQNYSTYSIKKSKTPSLLSPNTTRTGWRKWNR